MEDGGGGGALVVVEEAPNYYAGGETPTIQNGASALRSLEQLVGTKNENNAFWIHSWFATWFYLCSQDSLVSDSDLRGRRGRRGGTLWRPWRPHLPSARY